MRILLVTISLLLFITSVGQSQDIDFRAYADYGLDININEQLVFDKAGPLIANGNTYSLTRDQGALIEIVGVKYLDIYVNVFISQPLTGDNTTETIDNSNLALKAAYSNQSGNNSNASLKYITVGNNTFNLRAPMLERQSQPPNPPPTPPTNATDIGNVDPSNSLYETFYIHLYGDLTIPEGTSADSYTGHITIEVYYEEPNQQ